MKKCSRILSMVLVLAFMFVSFAACGDGNTKENNASNTSAQETSKAVSEESTASNVYAENGLPKDQNVVLKVAFQEAGYGREYFDYAVETFTKKFPNVKIEVTASPKTEELVNIKVQAGNDEEMFDLSQVGWQQYANAGKLEPVDDLYERSPYDAPGKKLKDLIANGFYENLTKGADGKYYYVPQSYYVGGLFFDKKLFKENGWNQHPKTYDEFNQLCETIKAKGIAPMVVSGVYNYMNFAVWFNKGFEIAQINGTLDSFTKAFRETSGPYYSSPELIEAYKRVYDMGKKGYFAKGLSALNHTQSQMAVIQRKAAMVMTADWVENEMKGSTPSGFEWGYMAIPYINDASQPVWIHAAEATSMVIWKAKPELNKKWAKEFLLWQDNLDCLKAVAEKAGALPIRKDYADDPNNLANLRSIHKSILEYLKNTNYKFENNYRTVTRKVGQSAVQGQKVFDSNTALFAEAKKDPETILKQADALYQKGFEEGEKLK